MRNYLFLIVFAVDTADIHSAAVLKFFTIYKYYNRRKI